MKLKIAVFLMCLLFPLSALAATSYEGYIVKQINIKGNNRIDKATIAHYIHTEVGKKYSGLMIRKDIKRIIYKIGHIDSVAIDAEKLDEGLKLTYYIVEKALIHSFRIEGNDDVTLDDIKEEIRIKKGEVLDKTLIKESVENIRSLYKKKGFYFADILSETEDSVRNQVDVVFTIKENKKIKINNIEFTGNENISNRKLKKIIMTGEKGFFSWVTDWFSESRIYKKEVLQGDIEIIKSFYHDKGYARVVVYDPDVDIDKENGKINIKINIKEGQRYNVGGMDISGDDTFTKDELLEKIELKKGDTYNKSLLREGIFEIQKLYSEKGYAYVDISPVIKILDEQQEVNINMDIFKGRKFYVGNITITGNDDTRDRVIRREFRLQEGDVFDSWKYERTRERIFALGFFDDIKLDYGRGEEDDLLDINLDVTERSTGQFSVSAGYSSVEKFVFQVQVSKGNLFGRGQTASVTAEKSSIRTEFSFDFYEPMIFDQDLSAGFNVFTRDLNNVINESKSIGGNVRIGKALTEYSKGSLKYKYKYINIKKVNNPTRFNEEGVKTISSLVPGIFRDTRDNPFSPTKGSNSSITFEYAGGPLGGTDFYKANLETSKYIPLKWKFIGLLHGKFGFAEPFGNEELLPYTERYFLGGATNLRGFDYRNVGPRDGNGSVGGNRLILFNAEIHYPFSKAVRGFIFYDRGNVFGRGPDMSVTDDDYNLRKMRHSYGLGVMVFTPIGPIGLSYGIKLDRKEGESAGKVQFNIGKMF